MISGVESTMKNMRNALSTVDIPVTATVSNTNRNNDINANLYSLLSQYLPEIMNSMGRQIVLDTGAVVGELAPAMDTRLGMISGHKGRGN